MKKLITLSCFLWISGQIHSQSISQPVPSNSCATVFSEQQEALLFRDSLTGKCFNLVIEDLKPYLSGSFPVKTILTVGSYTFNKGANLEIPEDTHIYIEDQLTGQLFDLNTSNAYSFKVTRTIAERFILYIEKTNSKTANKTAKR